MTKKQPRPIKQPGSTLLNRRGLLILGIGLLAIIALIVLRAATAGFDASRFQQPQLSLSPEQQFNAALDNQMNTPYIGQNAVQSAGGAPLVRLDAVSDFSNPATPNSKISLRYASNNNAPDIQQYDRNFIMINTDLYVQLPEYASVPNSNYVTGQWYLTPANNTAALEQLDIARVAKGVNTPLGQILVGKFSDSDRKALTDFITNEKVYAIVKSTNEKLDGKDTRHYIITINSDKLNQLNKKAADLLSINTIDTSQIKILDAWVSNNDNRFQKVIYHIANDTMSANFNYTIPATPPTIVAPSPVTNA